MGAQDRLIIWLPFKPIFITNFKPRTFLRVPAQVAGNFRKTAFTSLAIRKGKMMNTLVRIYIYYETKVDNRTNDKCAVRPNIIFDTLILKDTKRGHSSLIPAAI